MEVKPVKTYRRPQYPQKAEVGRDPSLLRRIPHRWAKNTAVLTALGMTLALGACTRGDTAAERTPAPSGSWTRDGEPEWVAPIFEHGGGSGSFGCAAVLSPFFLSEEEAFEIIRSEAEDYGGLSVSEGGPTLPVAGNPPEVKVDGELGDGVSFIFVSEADVSAWGWPVSRVGSAEKHDYFRTAESLKGRLESAGTGEETPVGIFYEPGGVALTETEYAELASLRGTARGAYIEQVYTQPSREFSEENLRAQVRDFIDWLRGQGLI